MGKQGMTGKHTRVDRMPDDEVGSCHYLNVLEGVFSDLYPCSNLVPHEVSAESNSLAFYVVVCLTYRAKEIYD